MFEQDLRELLDRPLTGLAPTKDETAAADFTMVNLEASLTTGGTRDAKELEEPDNRYYFRAGRSALTALRAAGVDAVSVANNHGADFGAEGLADTLQSRTEVRCPSSASGGTGLRRSFRTWSR